MLLIIPIKLDVSETASQIKSTKPTPKYKVGDYVRNADKRNIFSKGYTSIGIENCLKLMNF